MTTKEKYELIDKTKINPKVLEILQNMEKSSKNFTDEAVNAKIDGALDKLIEGFRANKPEALRTLPEAKKEVKKEKEKAQKKNEGKDFSDKKDTDDKTGLPKKDTLEERKEIIKKESESEKEARDRARKELEKEKEKAKDEVESQIEKLNRLILEDPALRGFNTGTAATGGGRSTPIIDAERKALPRGSRVSHKGWKNQYGASDGGRKYWENRENRSDRKSPEYETGKPYLAQGGNVYSSDELYIVKVYDAKTNELLDMSKRVWARNLQKAKEEAIDNYEYDMKQQYGDNLLFKVEEAPSMFADGGEVGTWRENDLGDGRIELINSRIYIGDNSGNYGRGRYDVYKRGDYDWRTNFTGVTLLASFDDLEEAKKYGFNNSYAKGGYMADGDYISSGKKLYDVSNNMSDKEFQEAYRKLSDKEKDIYDELNDGYENGGEVETILVVPKYLKDEIEESINLGYDELVVGMISKNRKGVLLINDNYEVRGTYDIGLKNYIEKIIEKHKTKKSKGGYMEHRGTITDDSLESILKSDFPKSNYQMDYNEINGYRIYGQKDVIITIQKHLLNEYGVISKYVKEGLGLPYLEVNNQFVDKYAKGGYMAKGGSMLEKRYYAYPSGDEGGMMGDGAENTILNNDQLMMLKYINDRNKGGEDEEKYIIMFFESETPLTRFDLENYKDDLINLGYLADLEDKYLVTPLGKEYLKKQNMAHGGEVGSWESLTIEKMQKDFPFDLKQLNRLLKDACKDRDDAVITNFQLSWMSKKYDTFANLVYDAGIYLKSTGSDNVSPSGTYHSQKGLSITFYLRQTYRSNGSMSSISIDASMTVAGGMEKYKSIDVANYSDIYKYISAILRDNPKNNLGNSSYAEGGMMADGGETESEPLGINEPVYFEVYDGNRNYGIIKFRKSGSRILETLLIGNVNAGNRRYMSYFTKDDLKLSLNRDFDVVNEVDEDYVNDRLISYEKSKPADILVVKYPYPELAKTADTLTIIKGGEQVFDYDPVTKDFTLVSIGLSYPDQIELDDFLEDSKGVSERQYTPELIKVIEVIKENEDISEIVNELKSKGLIQKYNYTMADGGEVDFSKKMAKMRSAYENLDMIVKSKIAMAIGIDNAVSIMDYDYVVHPFHLIKGAVSSGLLEIDEINGDLVGSAIQEAERIDEDYRDSGEGIGSSDITYFTKSMLRDAGYKTEFINHTLKRVDDDGNELVINKYQMDF